MARPMTAVDACALMNDLVLQATGSKALTTVNTSNFVSYADNVLATGTDNVLNALSLVIGRTLVAVRPYKAKLMIVQALNTGLFTHRMRKVSYYEKPLVETGAFNTDINPKNLYDGFDNGKNGTTDATASMWVQDKPVAVETNFFGSSVYQSCLTVYKVQLQNAFRSPEEFANFVSGIMTNKANELELAKEAYSRMTVISAIAKTYHNARTHEECAVNLTEEFNTEFNTNHTSEELRTTYLADFLKFFVARIKSDMRMLTHHTSLYHLSPSVTKDGVTYNKINRHTPMESQRLMLYAPFFIKSEAYVFPEIFNTNYLDINKQYEGVDFWQSFTKPTSINVKTSDTGDAVSIPYVLGFLFDKDAIMVDYQLDDVSTTPLEARKKYQNTWWTVAKNSIVDETENMICYYMAD